ALVPAEQPDGGNSWRKDAGLSRVPSAMRNLARGSCGGGAAVELASAATDVPLRQVTGLVIGGPQNTRGPRRRRPNRAVGRFGAATPQRQGGAGGDGREP